MQKPLDNFWSRIQFIYKEKKRAYALEALAFMAILWPLLRWVEKFFPTQIENFISEHPWAFWTSLAFSLLYALYRTYPVDQAKKFFEEKGVEIEIAVNENILDIQSHILVIPVNNQFHFDMSKTLIGAFIDEEYEGNDQEFRKEVEELLNSESKFHNLAEVQVKPRSVKLKDGSRGRKYDFGTSLLLNGKKSGRQVVLTVAAEIKNNTEESTDFEALTKAYSGLWKFLRRFGREKQVVMSVWGFGKTSRSDSKLTLAELLILSFMMANNGPIVANKLLINVRPINAANNIGLFHGLKEFLDTLHL